MKFYLKKHSNQDVFIYLITMFILVLPYAKLKIGAMPLYFIDIISIILLIKLAPLKYKKTKLGKLFLLYWILTVLVGIVEFTNYLAVESIYMIMRYSLSMFPILILPRLIKNKRDFSLLLKVIVISLFINALLTICYTFSGTRSIVSPIFNNEILFPQRERLIDQLTKDNVSRGTTLAGNPNSTAYLLFMGIIVAFGYLKLKDHKKIIIMLSVFLGMLGVILTMSRAAYLTLTLISLYILWLKSTWVYVKYLGIAFLIFFCLLSFFKIETSRLKFERVYEMINIFSGKSEAGYSEQARIESWTLPLQNVIDHPQYFFIGRGFSSGKLSRLTNKTVKADFEITGGRNHSFFASITYDRGLLSFFIFTTILFYIYRNTFFNGMKFLSTEQLNLNTTSKLLLLNLVFPLLTEHNLVDRVAGSYQLFFSLSLILVINNFINRNIRSIVVND